VWGDEQPQADLFIKLLDMLNPESPSLIELGCSGTNSCYYSIHFEKRFKGKGTIICTEPDKALLDNIRVLWKDKHLVNAKLYNGYSGELVMVQAEWNEAFTRTPKLRIKDLMAENNLAKLDILHADVQGSEVSVMKELVEDKIIDKIRYFFISLHNTHKEIENIFNENLNVKYHYNDPYKGGYGDGLIVAENLNY
jgi:FkbM family methyltransferase